MSAFIVNVDHIDYLVTAVGKLGADLHMRLRVPDDTTARVMGAVLSPTAVTDSRNLGPMWEPEFDTTTLGRLLLTENIRSVAYRYPEDAPGQWPGPIPNPEPDTYIHRPVPWDQITPAGVVMAVKCWRYQSDQIDDHAQSMAWRVMDELYEMAITAMIRTADPNTWNWTRPRP